MVLLLLVMWLLFINIIAAVCTTNKNNLRVANGNRLWWRRTRNRKLIKALLIFIETIRVHGIPLESSSHCLFNWINGIEVLINKLLSGSFDIVGIYWLQSFAKNEGVFFWIFEVRIRIEKLCFTSSSATANKELSDERSHKFPEHMVMIIRIVL